MTKKIKLIDRLKSWLVTLGIASVFGLAALGVNAANSYQKASAYTYQDNGTINLYFLDDDVVTGNDNTLFWNYVYNSVLSTGESEPFDEIDFALSGFILAGGVQDEFYGGFISTMNSNDLYINLYTEDTGYILHYNSSYVLTSVDNDYDTSISSFDLYFTPSNVGYQSLRNYILSYNAPQESGNFVTALTSFMSLIGGGIVQLAQSVGAGVVSFASGLFLDNGSLSILGGIIGIFAGIALAVGITTKVYTWVTSLGN